MQAPTGHRRSPRAKPRCLTSAVAPGPEHVFGDGHSDPGLGPESAHPRTKRRLVAWAWADLLKLIAPHSAHRLICIYVYSLILLYYETGWPTPMGDTIATGALFCAQARRKRTIETQQSALRTVLGNPTLIFVHRRNENELCAQARCFLEAMTNH